MLMLNGWELETGKFPNGESWVNIRNQFEVKSHNQIKMIFESNDDLVNLLFLKKHLDEMGVQSRLVAEYLPYSRMDRYNGHYAFSLKYIAEFINSLGFYSVVISEPHSDVTPALISRVRRYDWIADKLTIICNLIEFDPAQDLLCFPDAGAVKRYGGELSLPYCYGQKVRDFQTGNITGLNLVSVAEKARKVLIVDDLCSRGGTFLEIGKCLKNTFGKDAEIYLAVAHCEANVFSGELLKKNSPIKQIFTSLSLQRDEHPNISVIA
jgi:ribose-phosphate pyrophosphokinase